MPTSFQDIRFALRQLRRSPGFVVTAVLTLALGIGATTAMYSIARCTLLAPLPYPHAEELVGLGFSHRGEAANDEQTGETADSLLAHATSFASMGVADDGPFGQNFSNGNGAAQTIRSLRVSSGYLPTLNISPLLGRTFTRQEDLPGATPTVVLSEALWRRALNADPQIIGRNIHLNAEPYTVIGVMPASLTTVDAPDLWQPLQLSPMDPGYQGDNYQMIGRLRPGLSMSQASAELTNLTQSIYRQFPHYLRQESPGLGRAELVWPLQQVLVSNARSSVVALSAAVLAVLLMACLNLAGLMIARSAARHSEIALRTALGASRVTTVRLLLTDSLLLALVGSLLGLLFARVAVPILLSSSAIDLPQLQHAAINLPVIIFAMIIGCATTLLFGLLPALSVFRQTIGSRLGGTRTVGHTAPQQRLGGPLIVAQVGLAATLLSTAALLLTAFLHMRSTPPGVRPLHLYTLQVNLRGVAYASSVHSQQFISAVETRLREIPGVARVAAVNGLPLDRGLNTTGGPANRPDLIRYSEARFITPGYFRTAGTTLLQGDDISESDTASGQQVALINQVAAQRWFPDHSPIGEFVITGGGKPRRVIGIVANVHDDSLAGDIEPTIYVPYTQVDDESMKAINGWFPTTFVLRTAERPEEQPDLNIAAAASATVAAVDPEVPASKFASMQSFMDTNVATPRFFSWLAGSFAVFALLLTLIGLFGLVSYQVASRTREFGVRMALGAQRAQILNLVLRNGLVLTAFGLGLGTVCSFALRRVLAAFIAGTTQVAPGTLSSLLGGQFAPVGIVGATMLLSCAAACFLPAHRAASIEPTEALRAD